jgi:transcriptional regulator with XRE-family HTH domain
MKATIAVQTVRKEKKVTYDQLAKAVGAKSYSNIKNLLSDKANPTIDSLIPVLEALGYEMVIQPKKQGRRPEGQYVIDVAEE